MKGEEAGDKEYKLVRKKETLTEQIIELLSLI
jgi:hypothetical protein